MKLIKYKNSLALIGNSRHLKDKIMSNKLGIWIHSLNINNEKIGGWIFKPEKLNDILTLLQNETFTNETDILLAKVTIIEPTNTTKPTYNKQLLHDYLKANLHVLIEQIGAEMKIGSVITNDLSVNDKKYLFLGAGCGFSFIECDKRNKLAVNIIEDSQILKHLIDKELIKCIDPTYIKKLELAGNPIQAHLIQNLNYKSCYNYLVTNFMSKFVDMKKIYVKNIDD